MEKAIVLGASGGMGTAITLELASRGVNVTAFARNKEKLERLFGAQKNIQIYSGDVFNKEDLIAAAEGMDVIFHAINIPYPEWAAKQAILFTNILDAATKHQAKLAVVDNIYAYGRSSGKAVTEAAPKHPHTRKGAIRLELEELAKQSSVPFIIAHFPDFYGPHAESSLLHMTFQAIVHKKRALYVGNQSIAREFIYTPDGAKAIVELAARENAYGQSWNIPGAGTITGEEIIAITKSYTRSTKKVITVTKTMIRLLGLFNPMMKEYVEMYYLNEQPVVLCGDKYEQEVGPLPRTSYQEGIIETLKSIENEGE